MPQGDGSRVTQPRRWRPLACYLPDLCVQGTRSPRLPPPTPYGASEAPHDPPKSESFLTSGYRVMGPDTESLALGAESWDRVPSQGSGQRTSVLCGAVLFGLWALSFLELPATEVFGLSLRCFANCAPGKRLLLIFFK